MCVSEGEKGESSKSKGKWEVVGGRRVCVCVREGAKVERWYDMIRYDTMEVFDAQTL